MRLPNLPPLVRPPLAALLISLAAAPPAAADPPAGAHPGPEEGHAHTHREAHGGDHATMHRRFDDVEWAKRHFEGPERAAWQKPRELVAALKIAPGATVADLGAGSGYFLPHLAEAVGPRGSVIALEVEPKLLEWLRERVEREGLHTVVPVLSSFERPRLPRASLDLALMVNVYHHIEGRKAWFTHALQTLRPGGRLVVVDFKPGELPVGPPKGHKVPAEQIRAELAEAGWVFVEALDLLPHQNVLVFRRPPGVP